MLLGLGSVSSWYLFFIFFFATQTLKKTKKNVFKRKSQVIKQTNSVFAPRLSN